MLKCLTISFRILSAADRPNYIGWTSNAYYQITQDRDMTEDTSLIFVMQVDFRHLLHSYKIHGNVATPIRPSARYRKLVLDVPERVPKRHVYIMEDMYLYMVKTRDSSLITLFF